MSYFGDWLKRIERMEDEQAKKEEMKKYLEAIENRDKHKQTAQTVRYIFDQYDTGYFYISDEDWEPIERFADKFMRKNKREKPQEENKKEEPEEER